jgi:hypothetical protein
MWVSGAMPHYSFIVGSLFYVGYTAKIAIVDFHDKLPAALIQC